MAIPVTNDAEVKEVIETDLADLKAFRQAAAELIEATVSGLSASLKKEVERWLAAHFVAQRERQLAGESMLDSSEQYGGQFGMGLQFTQYGQQAMILDTSGKLAAANRKKRPIVVEVL